MTVLSKIRRRVFEGSAGQVYRGMLTLFVGTGAARIIGVASMPILTRLYDPEAFGTLSVFNSFVLIAAPIMTLRYVMAVPLPRNDAMAANLVALSVSLMAVSICLLAVLLGFFGEWALTLFSAGSVAAYWPLIIAGLLCLASYEVGLLWATRRRAYRITAQSQALQSFVGEGTKAVLGVLGLGAPGLIIGHVIAFGGGIFMMLLRFWHDLRQMLPKVSARRMKFVGAYYLRFPKYRLPSQFLLDAATQAPLLLTAAIYSVEVTGQLGLALMAIALPVTLLGNTMSNAYFAEISAIGGRKPAELRAITWSVVRTLFLLSLIPSLGLLLFGEILFTLAFGEAWRDAGLYASILSIYLLSQFVCAPITRIFSVLNMEHIYFFINLQRMLLVLLAFAPGMYLSFDAVSVLVLFSGSLSLHRMVVLTYVFFALKKRISEQRTIP